MIRLVGTRCKKVEFSNDFSVSDNFTLNPMINFNYSKLNVDNAPEGVSAYSVSNSVSIEGTSENKSPIRVNILVESIFETKDEAEDKIKEFLTTQGIEHVYTYARSILSSLTLMAGVRPIALPDRDKLSQGAQA